MPSAPVLRYILREERPDEVLRHGDAQSFAGSDRDVDTTGDRNEMYRP